MPLITTENLIQTRAPAPYTGAYVNPATKHRAYFRKGAPLTPGYVPDDRVAARDTHARVQPAAKVKPAADEKPLRERGVRALRAWLIEHGTPEADVKTADKPTCLQLIDAIEGVTPATDPPADGENPADAEQPPADAEQVTDPPADGENPADAEQPPAED